MSKTEIIIRRASLLDLETIVSFNEALARETEGKRLDRALLSKGVKRALSDPSCCTYWLAEIDGHIAGQTMITVEWSDWRNGFFWWIQSVYVRAEFRRKGVFQAIYQHIQSKAKAEEDVCGIRLYVYHDNKRAMETYSSLGMAESEYRFFEEAW